MSDAASVEGAELGDPAADGLVGDLDAALCQAILHVTQTEAEATVKPDGVLDALAWEAVPGVGAGQGAAAFLARTRRRNLNLTGPAAEVGIKARGRLQVLLDWHRGDDRLKETAY